MQAGWFTVPPADRCGIRQILITSHLGAGFPFRWGDATAGCTAWQRRSSTASTSGSCSSTASNPRKPLVQKAPVRASSQKESASLAGSTATASTKITSRALAVAAASAANR